MLANSREPGITLPSARRLAATAAGLTLVCSGVALGASPAQAAVDHLVISEAYGGGGNSGATYKNDFIELYNPTASAVDLSTWSVQYRSAGASATTAGSVTRLTGSIPAGGHYLVQEAAGTGGTTALPAPDATGTIAMSGTGFQVWLSNTQTAIVPPSGNVPAGTSGIVDFVGSSSTASSYETSPAPAPTNTTALTRDAAGTDSDRNAVDITTAAPAPQNAGPVTPPPEPTTVDRTIAEVQGTGSASPYAGDPTTYVRTRGVVTAAYPRGGFYGFVIQTPGTGTGTDATPGASDGLYVYQTTGGVAGQVGDLVEVTGLVSEFGGLTELTYDPADTRSAFTVLPDAHDPVAPRSADLPTTTADREAHESELLDLSGQPFTVSSNYATNQYAEIGLATGTTPLVAPTEEYDAQDSAAIAAATAANAARAITLDDGSSTNFLPFGGGPAQDIPLPWLSATNTVRVSSAATFRQPVVLDYRNSTWKLQPTHQVTDEGTDVVTFSDTRAENQRPQDVGGDLTLATSNVLNFFNTTGEDYVAGGSGRSCTYYVDRDDQPVTDDTCTPNGPRGAAQEDDLVRQRDKIVAAINTLDADIVSLEEVENSVALGEADRDDALSDLVDHLNTAAGTDRWAFVPSPAAADLPPTADQDVIRTAFIYDPATVQPVGASKVLVGAAAFNNAREPLAQTFKPKGAPDRTTFGVIVNHFKSKGSGANDGTGQGNANPDRIAQARALATFADDFTAERGITKLFLTGDFNSYSMEDPVQELEAAGYTSLESDQADEWTYNFSGSSGSLDHVFANAAALGDVTGVDIWNNNADESVAYEYSRANYNVTDFYVPNQFRASDHDPEIIGVDVPGFPAVDTTTEATSAPMTYGTDGSVAVQVSSSEPTTGTVTLLDGTTEVASAPVADDGTATITVPGTGLRPGSHDLVVAYSGDDGNRASQAPVTVAVDRATPTLALTLTPGSSIPKNTRAGLTVGLTAPQQTVTGQVTVQSANGTKVVQLVDGSAHVDLGVFKQAGTYPVTVSYAGSDLAKPVTRQVTLTVTKK